MSQKAIIKQTRPGAGGIGNEKLHNLLCESRDGDSDWIATRRLVDGERMEPCHSFIIDRDWVTETGQESGFRYVIEDLGDLTIGSRVILDEKSRFYCGDVGDPHNPGDRIGTVTKITDEDWTKLHISVEWDNGRQNSYAPEDLNIADESARNIIDNFSGKVVRTYKGRVEVIGVMPNDPMGMGMVLVRLLDRPSEGHNGNGYRVLVGGQYEYTTKMDTDLWYALPREVTEWGVEVAPEETIEEEEIVEETGIEYGDLVYLSKDSKFYSDKHADNHNPGIRVGRVIDVRGIGLSVRVDWGNGIINAYYEDCLVKLSDHQKAIYEKVGTRVRYGDNKGTIVGFGGMSVDSPIVMFDEKRGHSGNEFRLFLGSDYSRSDFDGNILYLSGMTAERIEEIRIDDEVFGTTSIVDHIVKINLDDILSTGAGIGIDLAADEDEEEDNRRLIFAPRQIEEAAMFLELYSPLTKSAQEFEDHIYERIRQCYNGDWEDGFRSALGYTIRVDTTDGLDYDGYHTMEVEVSVDPALGSNPEMFQGTVDESGKVVVNFPQR